MTAGQTAPDATPLSQFILLHFLLRGGPAAVYQKPPSWQALTN